jgi:hypothetical protein
MNETSDAKTDRQRGALLGLAIGDALGAAIEFRSPGTFDPVTGYRAGGPHGLAAGEWTDDTSMALALADSIAESGWDLNDQAERYVKWWRTGAYSVIRNMMAYVPGFNPGNRRDPTPRPDYLINNGMDTVAVLDAKYRDLWTLSLPREMLYQLAIYALSGQSAAQATILYPSTDPRASKARIEIRHPLHGRRRADVILRPVDLSRLERLISSPNTVANNRHKREYATQLVFGGDKTPVRTLQTTPVAESVLPTRSRAGS